MTTVTTRRRPTGDGPGQRPAARRVPLRLWAFATLCALCITGAVGYTVLAARRAAPAPGQAAPAAVDPAAARALQAAPHVLFRSSAIDGNYGRLTLAPLDDPGGPRAATGLQCERVAFAAGRGVCLVADRGFLTTYRAVTFGPDLRPVHELRLAGSPSRVRVSPDGGLGAITVFVTGHSYAAEGFSTATTLLDLRTGADLGNLEEFAVSRDGQRFWSQDFNFWGVTFTGDGNRFYATLATGGQTHLVEGDVAARASRVLRDNVECPSLSPDGARLVFKKRVGGDGPVTWRLHLLELATMRETPLAETRNVDDQVEWLDDGQVLYALPIDPRAPTAATNTWAVAVEGQAVPRLFLPHGDSPAVVR